MARFFDRITRPEQLLTALPEAMRVLVARRSGAVVRRLPQDIQTEAYDFPVAFFDERDWTIRRPAPDPDEIAAVGRLLADAERPLIIAGGGVPLLRGGGRARRARRAARDPRAETFAGKGAVRRTSGGGWAASGSRATRPPTQLAAEADVVVSVGTRLTDFATGVAVALRDPGVRFAGINVDPATPTGTAPRRSSATRSWPSAPSPTSCPSAT